MVIAIVIMRIRIEVLVSARVRILLRQHAGNAHVIENDLLVGLIRQAI
jgi:hypothetical protein